MRACASPVVIAPPGTGNGPDANGELRFGAPRPRRLKDLLIKENHGSARRFGAR
jgi:hypothetical protein